MGAVCWPLDTMPEFLDAVTRITGRRMRVAVVARTTQLASGRHATWVDAYCSSASSDDLPAWSTQEAHWLSQLRVLEVPHPHLADRTRWIVWSIVVDVASQSQ